MRVVSVQGNGLSETSKVNPEFWKRVVNVHYLALKIMAESYHNAKPDPKTGMRKGKLPLAINYN